MCMILCLLCHFLLSYIYSSYTLMLPAWPLCAFELVTQEVFLYVSREEKQDAYIKEPLIYFAVAIYNYA